MLIFWNLLTKWAPSLCNMAHGACCTTVVSGAMHLADKLENSGSVKAPQGGHCLTRRCDVDVMEGAKWVDQVSVFIEVCHRTQNVFHEVLFSQTTYDLRSEKSWASLKKTSQKECGCSIFIRWIFQGGQFWVPKRSRQLKEKDLGLLRCDEKNTGLSKQTLCKFWGSHINVPPESHTWTRRTWKGCFF